MKLSDIKAKKAVFQAVDPVHGEPIEDLVITFKVRSDTAAYGKFHDLVKAGALDNAEGSAKAFFCIIDEATLGEYDFSEEGLAELLSNPDCSFFEGQLTEFYLNNSNFFTIAKSVKKKK